jgi:hypothetical protein
MKIILHKFLRLLITLIIADLLFVTAALLRHPKHGYQQMAVTGKQQETGVPQVSQLPVTM